MTSTSCDHINIFISYSHKDEEHLARLKVHLAPYIDGDMDAWLWDDTRIQTGTQWRKEIDEALGRASAAILLVSADFMASRFIRDNELPPLLAVAEEKGIRIMPVILSPCGFDEKKNLSQFQVAHKPSETLSGMRSPHKKELWWASVAKNIGNAIGAEKAKRLAQENVADDYTEERFNRDVQAYARHMESSFHHLRLGGIVPKDRITNPELNGIFVPVRIALQDKSIPEVGYDLIIVDEAHARIALRDQTIPEEKRRDSIVTSLEQYPCMVLLGGPGAGKSTAVRHLAWSHAQANLPDSSASLANVHLLSGNPLPLRIELRLLTEARRQHPSYSFLMYAVEGLLKPNHVEVSLHMFERLLEQGNMLVLFDGLDEVASLDERRRLVEQIEHFAQRYPGNRILVTSRPVGYELAPLSNQWFIQAQVQEFNDEQIRQFLERWYTYVLRLSPIPHDAQQELEILFKALKDNTRLHKLAENPLLLTVITELHHYERLPDRRVQVYDRCAELLLEKWASLKGTNARWKDMKMDKEDQYACIAYLGFTLHERSQEEKSDSAKQETDVPTEDIASDVSTRVMLREIEHFLSSRKLITDVAAQRAEAKRFLELMQVEAGLIVERGTGESDEILYGFVHRTFQEYFAAADVYERYQQEVEPTIISEFLKEHLHDPHWREVILLLLGKLKRKPATAQLRQILEGKIESRRSRYRDVVQQDMFFVCDCLIDEITVESELAEVVVSRLSDVVKNSPFPSQRTEALEALGSLVQTRQYASLAREELVAFATKDVLPDLFRRIEAAEALYRSSPDESEEEKQAMQMLVMLAQRDDLTVEQAIQAAEALYRSSSTDSEEQKQAMQMLMMLAQRPDVTVEQTIQAAAALYQGSPRGTEEKKQAAQILVKLAQGPDLTVEQTIQAAQTFYENIPWGSEEQKQAAQMLVKLAHRPDVTVEQAIQAAWALYVSSPPGSEEEKQAVQMLMRLAQRPGLTIEQAIQAAGTLYVIGRRESEERKQAVQMLMRLAQRPDLTVEQAIQATAALYQGSLWELEERKQAVQMLMRLAQRPDLTVEQAIQATAALYQGSLRELEERKQAVQRLWQLAEDRNLGVNQRLQAAVVPLMKVSANYADRAQAVQIVLSLLQGEAARQYLEEHWQSSYPGIAGVAEILYVAELAKQELLPTRARDEMYGLLSRMVSQFDKVDVAGE